ncbi:MAG: DUF4350 domain-containing protein [Cyanobacteria bacterium J06581_3]
MKSLGNNRRTWIIGILAFLALALIFVLSAPASNRINSGSTWSNAPDGYRAWYAYMEAQGVTVTRWQRPIEDLLEEVAERDQPATLLQVRPAVLSSTYIGPSLYDWREQGNRVIILSQQDRPVTAAPFTSQISSESGAVTVETRRRTQQSADDSLLADSYGAVVWQDNRQTDELAEDAKGIVRSLTPYLAANAYANEPGNFAFLANLVQQAGGTIYVDEYIHGYKDSDVVVEEVAGSWINYLAETPLLIATAQVLVVLLIALLAQNRRFGLKKRIPPVQVNNSDAYIQALAGVLHKANNHDFLVETLTRAEQKSLQRALGLGDALVSMEVLQTAWEQATGRRAGELAPLRSAPRTEGPLKDWLQRLQSLHVLAVQRDSALSDSLSKDTHSL